MFKPTQEIFEVLKGYDGLKVFTEDGEKSSSVWLQFVLEDGHSFKISLISTSDDNDVAVRVFALVNVATEKIEKVLPVLNSINNKYRFLKFVCDDNGDIDVSYDFLNSSENIGKMAFEIVVRIADVVKECYPEIMRALWS